MAEPLRGLVSRQTLEMVSVARDFLMDGKMEKHFPEISAIGSLAAVVIAIVAFLGAVNAPAVTIAKIQQIQVQQSGEIAQMQSSLRNNRRDQERILIVVTALAKANGIAIPLRGQMP